MKIKLTFDATKTEISTDYPLKIFLEYNRIFLNSFKNSFKRDRKQGFKYNTRDWRLLRSVENEEAE